MQPRLSALAAVLFLGGLLAAPAAHAAPDEGLWFHLSFDEGLTPDLARIEFATDYLREGPAVSPEGRTFADGSPRFVDGVFGKAVFLGAGATNLLSPELSTMDLTSLPATVTAAGGASISVADDDTAWIGDKSLRVVQSTGRPHSGVRFAFSADGLVSERGAPGLYVFSFHIRSAVAAEVTLQADAALEVSQPATIKTSYGWRRVSVWMFADKPTEASVLIAAPANRSGVFHIDGVQLELKPFGKVSGSPEAKPYGSDFSASPWTPGGTTAQPDRLVYRSRESDFPTDAGSYSVWFKPGFPADDAETHPILSWSHVYYQLTLQNFRQYSFYRINRDPELGENNRWGDVRVLRLAGFTQGQWHLLTATWSDADRATRLYFDGDLVGEKASYDGEDASRAVALWVGAWGDTGVADGALDDLRIYSRALSPDEIRAMHRQGEEALARR